MALRQGGIITIVGPTASGKSALALELARRYKAVILCADSRTIYRGMNVGTAKPTDGERQEVVHYGLDLINPDEIFSAYDFQRYAERIIAQEQRNDRPIVMVGGSGMYIDSVLFGYHFRGKSQFVETLNGLSHDQLIKLAQERYPAEIAQLDVKNTRRIQQLLERGPSSSNDRKSINIDTIILGIAKKDRQLKENIGKRTKYMLSHGIVQETQDLQARFGEDCPGLSVIGYNRVRQYLNNELDADQMETLINRDTWQFARRQKTWFQRNPHICWSEDDGELHSLAADYLHQSSVK